MTTITKAIPDGYYSVTPYLSVRDAAKAIEFYRKAFNATELMRLTDSSGRIAHAEIKVGDSPVMLAEEFPEWGNRSPQSLGGTPVTIALYVEDVDSTYSAAIAAGAQSLVPVGDQFYGDRSGRLADPFGHVWIVATHKEDLSTEEMQKRFDAFMQQQKSAKA